jgi:hypothetical protein
MTLAQRISRIPFATATMCVAAILLAASQLFAQFEITWHTIDGGGAMGTTDGQPNGFELSGTIGQADAGPAQAMSGGSFTLVGGFWTVPSDLCLFPGDVNLDGHRNGLDIEGFVRCLTIGTSCGCADVDLSGSVEPSDVPVFVQMLLN